MQHYLIVWSFPTVDGAWESCPGFAEYINAGAPGDRFEGFELKYRVCEPVSGSGVAIALASDIGKGWAHLGPWIKGFGYRHRFWYGVGRCLYRIRFGFTAFSDSADIKINFGSIVILINGTR